MSRTIRNAKVDTPSARARLARRREPYWVVLNRGQALGYRKGVKGGTWIARFRMPNGEHQTLSIGPADDANAGEDDGSLSYANAQEKARSWFVSKMQSEGANPGIRVAMAMADYLTWYKLHRRALQDVTYRINRFILPEIGEIEVRQLTSTQIRKWHERLAERPALLRTKKGDVQRFREAPDDPERIRMRRATANKVLTILKAALNHAWHDGKVASDDAWRRVKPFPNVDAPRIRYLTMADCQRLANACELDFRRLVQAAMLTGCRYGELISLRCDDYNADTRAIHIRVSKSGRPRDVPLTDEGAELFASVCTGRQPADRIFVRSDGEPWRKSHQNRRLAAAAKRANVTGVSFHILRHVYGATLAQNGVPMRVIADVLGHADTRITEKHYAHLAPSHVAEVVRANLPRIGVESSSNVRTLPTVSKQPASSQKVG